MRSSNGNEEQDSSDEGIFQEIDVSETIDYRMFAKALALSLALMAVLLLLALIPFIGFFLVLTVSPLIAGYVGGKQYPERGMHVGIIAGILFSIALTFELLTLLSNFMTYAELTLGSLELCILSLIFMLNTLFCALGGRLAGEFQGGEK